MPKRSKTPRGVKKKGGSDGKTNNRKNSVKTSTPSSSKMKSRTGLFAPTNTPIQNKAANNMYPPVPNVCFVTGGTGLCGLRLVEMLVERGAKKVISFDIVPPPPHAWKHKRIEWRVGDITNVNDLVEASKGVDCVWHLAAAVGPFHPTELYDKINYQGTLNVIEACKINGIKKLVMSTSPSTRMDGSDLDGVRTTDLPKLPMKSYLQAYAGSKARGELAARNANDGENFFTVAVAPHQVYGPRDNLFLPNVLESYGGGTLRCFTCARTGYGKNKVCFTFVDNYCHGLIISERVLYKNSPALGKFYIVTDGATHPYKEGYAYLWELINETGKYMGFPEIKDKVPYPSWLLMPLAYVMDYVGWAIGKKMKLNPFNINMLTMHRWFRIDSAVEDLQYQPIISYDDGWKDTLEWFKQNWLPKYNNDDGTGASSAKNKTPFGTVAGSTLAKIHIQSIGVHKNQK